MTNKTDYTPSKGAWTAEEDRTLTQCIQKHGPRRWKSLAIRSGLNRCGKSCRLRWLNYLRPDIKRGNISDAEEDLILRLHRLLGNRWSLIAGRLPGRTDNEIKNYWNAHLRKKACYIMDKLPSPTSITPQLIMQDTRLVDVDIDVDDEDEDDAKGIMETSTRRLMDADEMSSGEENESFEFSTKETYGLDWVKKILELEEDDP